jgi:hypothetical protein
MLSTSAINPIFKNMAWRKNRAQEVLRNLEDVRERGNQAWKDAQTKRANDKLLREQGILEIGEALTMRAQLLAHTEYTDSAGGAEPSDTDSGDDE